MQESHRQAAEQHELAASAHRNAATHYEKADQETGNWHATRALDCASQAYALAQEAHKKSVHIGGK